jgi:hypothetical protein
VSNKIIKMLKKLETIFEKDDNVLYKNDLLTKIRVLRNSPDGLVSLNEAAEFGKKMIRI